MSESFPKFTKMITGKHEKTKDFTQTCELPINSIQKLNISSSRIKYASEARVDKIMYASRGLVRSASFIDND
jgi:hypothetical protein